MSRLEGHATKPLVLKAPLGRTNQRDISPPRPPSYQSHPAIRVSGLAYRYPDGKDALCGVELVVSTGESVAVVGPNGAGKSTLMLHLNAVLPGKARGSLRPPRTRGGLTARRRRLQAAARLDRRPRRSAS